MRWMAPANDEEGLSPVNVTKSYMESRKWCFYNGDTLATSRMQFSADGSVHGYWNANESRWRLDEGGLLVFMRTDGLETSRLKWNPEDMEFSGNSLINSARVLSLRVLAFHEV